MPVTGQSGVRECVVCLTDDLLAAMDQGTVPSTRGDPMTPAEEARVIQLWNAGGQTRDQGRKHPCGR